MPSGWCTAVLSDITPVSRCGVVDRPAEGDDAAPVVAERHDRAGQAQGVGEVAEVAHPLGERAVRAGAL